MNKKKKVRTHARPRTATDVVYVVIGLAGLFMIPRLLAELRMGTHRAHPTGA